MPPGEESISIFTTLRAFFCAFIGILSITGLVRAYPDLTQRWFDRAKGSPAISTGQHHAAGASKITIDDAVAIARTQLPASSLVRINIPLHKNEPYVVSARYPGDLGLFG